MYGCFKPVKRNCTPPRWGKVPRGEKEKTDPKDRYEPMTNADRIRNMTDEELAKLLSTGTFICEGRKDICENMPGCEECRLAWLKAPVEESEK